MTNSNKRDQILNAVIDIIQTSGLNSKIKVSEIAKKADVGKGTVYEYFSTKEEVLREAILYLIDKNIVYIRKAKGLSHLGFVDSLREIIKRVLETNDHMQSIFMYHDVSQVFSKESKMKIIEKMKSNYINHLKDTEDLVKKGVSEGIVSPDYTQFELRSILTMISGSCMEYVHMHNQNQEAFINDLIKVLLKILA